MVKPAAKRKVVDYLTDQHSFSERKSCRLAGISRRTYRYRSIKNDEELIEVLSALAEQYPGYGFWKLYRKMRMQGHAWNHKRVYRVYCGLKLNIRRRLRKRLPKRIRQPLGLPQGPDQIWSMDFMNDSLWNGCRFRILNIIDDYNREILAMEIDTSIPSERVVRVLDRLRKEQRLPKGIRVDNGPEFLSKIFQLWCRENQVKIHYIQPGKPTQNAYIERFNGSCRKELLDMYVFRDLQEVEYLAHEWLQEYNYSRPHEALNNLPPMTFKWENFVQ